MALQHVRLRERLHDGEIDTYLHRIPMECNIDMPGI